MVDCILLTRYQGPTKPKLFQPLRRVEGSLAILQKLRIFSGCDQTIILSTGH